ncbi:MAG: hypothetical protein PHP25_04475 [Candidatus Moranbacteria bacterium]|nr:hypothetical protein [Candidatus Moranbacteria bacterium]
MGFENKLRDGEIQLVGPEHVQAVHNIPDGSLWANPEATVTFLDCLNFRRRQLKKTAALFEKSRLLRQSPGIENSQ